MTQAKLNYKQDYAELVKLSKAIPQSVAVSDLMRELNRGRGHGDHFTNITMAAPTDAGRRRSRLPRRAPRSSTRSRSS